MSKDLTFRSELPATVEEVFALRTGQRWVDLKAEKLGDGSKLVNREERPDGGVDFSVSRELPKGVPGFLEKFRQTSDAVVHTYTAKSLQQIRDSSRPLGAN